jgi:GTP-binding protein HflX
LRFSTFLPTGGKYHEVVITDTVGFIKDLPKDLIGAFHPTFDELKESNLLIHLIDLSSPCFQEHIEAVEKILLELDLNHLPVLKVFNKEDRVDPKWAEAICEKYDGVSISALRPESLEKLLIALEKKLRKGNPFMVDSHAGLTNDESFDIQSGNRLIGARDNDGNPS